MKCKGCDTKLIEPKPSQKFCSEQCRSDFHNLLYIETITHTKECKVCKKEFCTRKSLQTICSKDCRRKLAKSRKPFDEDLSTGTAGTISELTVAADLIKKGWSVFRALSPNCFCDLVAYKKGKKIRLIEVRTGRENENGEISYCTTLRGKANEIAVYLPRLNRVDYIRIKTNG
jgi:hypothetical protein